jgi:hypothetical protein
MVSVVHAHHTSLWIAPGVANAEVCRGNCPAVEVAQHEKRTKDTDNFLVTVL